MKRVLIGAIFSLIGSIWILPIMFYANDNLVSSYSIRLGQFLTTIVRLNFMPMFAAAIVLIAAGIAILVIELFRKEK